MHHRCYFNALFKHFVPVLALILVLSTLLSSADSTRIRITLLPEALWSPTFGFGFGLRIKKRGLFTLKDHGSTTLAPAQRRQWASFTYQWHDLTARLHIDRNLARTFYGIGPNTSSQTSLRWPLMTLTQDLYLHHPFHRGGITTQLQWRRDWSLRSPSIPPSFRTDRPVLTWLKAHPTLSSIAFTATGYIDQRDSPAFPQRGYFSLLMLRGVRHFSPKSFRFLQMGFIHHQFFRPTPTSALAVRLVLIDTYDVGKTPIPFFLLPTLDYRLLPGYGRYRFTGPDLFVFSAESRIILKNLWDVWIFSATVGIHAGNTYESWTRQILLLPSWRIPPIPHKKRYPLHTGISLGFRIFSRRPERLLLNAVWGLSAETMSFAIISFVYHPGKTLSLPF